MKSAWDIFMPLIKRVATKGGVEDLAFYRAHDEELYFTPLVYVAACYTLFEVIFFSLIFVSMFQSNTIHALVFLGFSLTIGIGFNAIKMYLHIRKDAIEIKEMIKKMDRYYLLTFEPLHMRLEGENDEHH